MSRRLLALIMLPLMVVAAVVGVVIFDQGWGLATTILVGYATIGGLTIIGLLIALVVSPRGGRHSRPPASRAATR